MSIATMFKATVIFCLSIIGIIAFGPELARARRGGQTPSPNTVARVEKTYELPEAMQAEAKALDEAEKQTRQILFNIVTSATQIEVGPVSSVTFHSNIRDAQLRIETLMARRDSLQSRARLELNCKDCVLSAGGNFGPKGKA